MTIKILAKISNGKGTDHTMKKILSGYLEKMWSRSNSFYFFYVLQKI